MKHVRCGLFLAAILSLAVGTAWTQSPAPSRVSAPADMITDGTPIHMALGRTVSSESDQAGEVVEFLVKQDVVAGSKVLLPAGSSVYGKVISSQLGDRATGKSGELEFRMESLRLANGQEIPLRTIKQLPTSANADIKPEQLTNLVNSPYAPFAHFVNGPSITVPKSSALTLYVAADVNISNLMVIAKPAPSDSGADSVASRIVNVDSGAKSLGDIAREQRERGKISGGMVSSPQ